MENKQTTEQVFLSSAQVFQKLYSLPGVKGQAAEKMYSENKLNTGTAYLFAFFGLYYIYSRQGRFFLFYTLSFIVFRPVGLLRYIVTFFIVKKDINNQNKKILEKILKDFE